MKACNECGDKHYAKGKCKLHYRMPSQINPKPIKSNKPLQSIKTIKPIPKQSSKEKKRQASYNALRKVYMDQHPRCMFKNCQKPSTEVHHVRGRLGDYLLDTSEWMAVCGEHHVHIHNKDKESRELGYLKSRLGK